MVSYFIPNLQIFKIFTENLFSGEVEKDFIFIDVRTLIIGNSQLLKYVHLYW